ncbi:hypothetical protein [Methylocystis heyeri]|uniref:Apea-like HEPN domain-containing protein n=1 Tax=Methylocystis heyeri TaxID=391905 RepID=A0A6B8KDK6_9HYPH|nr:hypothetical protein [Methylocystis heyeri]QGM45111.1 hypothetical protein H2LOC_005080 [Methylocystis heyeri]
MSALSFPFGYYPRPLDLVVGPVTLKSSPDLAEVVARVEADAGIDNGWIYAPPQRVRHLGGGISERPYAARVFGLPKTHVITHQSAHSDNQLIFHLWAVSFLTGMRLTSTEAGFLDCTPIQPGKLVDFVLVGESLSNGIKLAENFWIAHKATPRRAKLFCAVIHAFFLAQNPRHLQFEEFLMLYTAFDACFALAKSLLGKTGSVRHEDRVAWMCDQFSMPVPAWANKIASIAPEVASLRNETIHEALFMGEPLGFNIHGLGTNRNLIIEMQALICRLAIALLGASSADYVRTPVNTRQKYGLRLA